MAQTSEWHIGLACMAAGGAWSCKLMHMQRLFCKSMQPAACLVKTYHELFIEQAVNCCAVEAVMALLAHNSECCF